jgi:hypothetical protein
MRPQFWDGWPRQKCCFFMVARVDAISTGCPGSRRLIPETGLRVSRGSEPSLGLPGARRQPGAEIINDGGTAPSISS